MLKNTKYRVVKKSVPYFSFVNFPALGITNKKRRIRMVIILRMDQIPMKPKDVFFDINRKTRDILLF